MDKQSTEFNISCPSRPELPVVQVNNLAQLLAVLLLYFSQPEQFTFKNWPGDLFKLWAALFLLCV